MSKIKIVLALSIIVLTSTACAALNPIVPTAEPEPTYVIVEPTYPSTESSGLTEASVPRVSIEEAQVAQTSGAAIIVDVRSKQAYDESHIPGAINILLGEFETNINGVALDKDQWIITYCT
jgi:3-mercaptopyruvate sulfurtransferase SseA